MGDDQLSFSDPVALVLRSFCTLQHTENKTIPDSIRNTTPGKGHGESTPPLLQYPPSLPS